MKNTVFDVIVVGAGQSGLSASYYLKNYGLNHLVFERGKIGESWRSQRWDSFRINSANKLNVLAGDNYKGNDPDGFCTAKEFVSSLQEYAAKFNLPVEENSKVISISKKPGDVLFEVIVSCNNHVTTYFCKQVIIASGEQNQAKKHPFAGKISAHVKQLHASEYCNTNQLPAGAVLITGSAQSGCQIAEDLLEVGRKVYLSTSMVARVPRRYRGKDIMDWLLETKFFDVRKEDITDPAMLRMRAPQLTGVGRTKTISLQSLAKKGAVILGKLENAEDKDLFFQSNAAMHVKFADIFSNKVKNMIDEFITNNKLSVPEAEFDEADAQDTEASCACNETTLNLEEKNINTLIWSTGFNADFSYLKLPVFDEDGNPKHYNGISEIEGLYFLGLHFLRARKSALIYGAKEDAKFIADKVYECSRIATAGPKSKVVAASN